MGGVGSSQCWCHNAKAPPAQSLFGASTPFSRLKGLWTGAAPLPHAAVSSGSQLSGGHELDGGQPSPLPLGPPPLPPGAIAVVGPRSTLSWSSLVAASSSPISSTMAT
ncbi:hypothetical protein NL676_029300 [Syzygium grande]|nr:hypothetical protein NL676_029300 [Syzygium grande]